MTSRKAETPEQAAERQEIERGAKALESLSAAIAADAELEIPPPVTEVKRLYHGNAPKMPAEAFELARQVYYLQHGNLPDCAKAIIDAGLSDTDNQVTVRERLRTWWRREKWPKRSHEMMVAVRDANFGGGLYRGDKCQGKTTGNGVAPGGKPCGGTRLADSEFCWQHDPRPEYVERRRKQAEKLTELRQSGMVPLGPFKRFCKKKRKELLAEEWRKKRRVHSNSQGWGLLADAMGVNQSHLKRLMQGVHTEEGRPPVTKIRAKTVARYVKPLGLTFEDVYGHPPPEQKKYEPNVCPECGGYKAHEAQKCRTCHEAEKVQCKYVNKFGKQCEIKTRHESGYCNKCREIVFRVPKPRVGRPSWIAENVLLHAVDEYRHNPNLSWVACVLWGANIGGCADYYKRRSGLASQLVKEWAKRGWRSPEDVEDAYKVMVAEQGEPEWPEIEQIESVGLVPSEPFREWLIERKAELDCSFKELAERLGMNPDDVSLRIRGLRPATGEMKRSLVDEALAKWGDGTTFEDLYAKASA